MSRVMYPILVFGLVLFIVTSSCGDEDLPDMNDNTDTADGDGDADTDSDGDGDGDSDGDSDGDADPDGNDCGDRPCENGSVCYDVADTYYCECTGKFTGRNCQWEIDDDEDCKELESNIDKNKRLKAGCYLAENNVKVNAKLTLDPGVWIAFKSGTGIVVENSGILIAEGDHDQRIGFSGQRCNPGAWDGMTFTNSGSLENELSYALILYAGDNDAALMLEGASESQKSILTISDTVIAESDSYGFLFEDFVNVEFDSNTITENREGPGKVHPNVLGDLDDDSIYTENGDDNDVLRITGGNVVKTAKWIQLDEELKYVVEEEISVTKETLTVDSGVTLFFEDDAKFTVDGDGALIVKGGSGDDRVRFTGTDQTSGHWVGLELVNNGSTANSLKNLIIEYAGSEGDEDEASLWVRKNARIDEIDNVEIRDGDASGFIFEEGARIEDINDFVVTENRYYPGKLTLDLFGKITEGSGNSLANNTEETIVILSGSVVERQKWDREKLGMDIRFEESVEVQDELTVVDMILYFDEDTGMTVTSEGSLEATNTTFTAWENNDNWDGLLFYQSRESNSLTDCIIEKGGNGRTHEASLAIYGASENTPLEIDISGCTISESDRYGVTMNGYVDIDTFRKNLIRDNEYIAKLHPNAIQYLSTKDGNQFDDNDHLEITVTGGEVIDDQTWPALDGIEYHIEGIVRIGEESNSGNAEIEVEIEAGAEFYFQRNTGLSVERRGQLKAVGTSSKKILFSAENKSKGNWRGLQFYSDGDNQLEYVTIEYGGQQWNNDRPGNLLWLAGIRNNTTSNLTKIELKEVTLKDSDANGVLYRRTALPAVNGKDDDTDTIDGELNDSITFTNIDEQNIRTYN